MRISQGMHEKRGMTNRVSRLKMVTNLFNHKIPRLF